MYLFYGTDSEKVRRNAFTFIEAAKKKQPDLAYTHLTREELTEATLDEVTSTGGLFVRRMLVVLDDPFGDESLVEEKISLLAESDNAIVIIAPKLLAAKAKKVSAKAAKSYEYNVAARREATRGFNSALVNALAAHDSKKLWFEIICALRAGDAPEAIHGLLHWKARDLLEKRPSAATRVLSLSLISLLMDSRRNSLDLAESLERWSLTI